MFEKLTRKMSDSLLPISRRVDWRFLFADVDLGHVVCVGNVDGELFEALQILGTQVTIWEGQVIEGCDLLVMRSPSAATFRQACHTIRARRFYVEFERHSLRELLWQWFVPGQCGRTAHRMGYDGVRTFWHWPDFAQANRIIPLDSPGALHFVLAKGRNDPRSRLKVLGGEVLLRTGLLAKVVPCLSLVGERSN